MRSYKSVIDNSRGITYDQNILNVIMSQAAYSDFQNFESVETSSARGVTPVEKFLSIHISALLLLLSKLCYGETNTSLNSKKRR